MTMDGTTDDANGGGAELAHRGRETAPTARDGPGPTPSAARWLGFVVLAAVVIAIDQLTKAWLTATVQPGESLSVVGDLVRLVHSRNSGGLFGLFRGSAELFAVASIGVIGLIVVYHARSRPSVLLTIALALLLGGAIGNLIDRIRFGYVIDFVDAGIGDLRFYTFNAADSAISTSIVLLVVLALFPRLAGGSTGAAGEAAGG